MNLPSKDVTCKCGHSFAIEKKSNWCEKCGNRIFYSPKDERAEKIHTYYVYTIVVAVMAFLTYLFIELIATPLLS